MGAIAVVFPGQGSQYVGMGQKFYQADPEARELFALAEAQAGLDLKKLCFEGPLDELTLTKNLQPAMALVDLICWRALARAGVQPWRWPATAWARTRPWWPAAPSPRPLA